MITNRATSTLRSRFHSWMARFEMNVHALSNVALVACTSVEIHPALCPPIEGFHSEYFLSKGSYHSHYVISYLKIHSHLSAQGILIGKIWRNWPSLDVLGQDPYIKNGMNCNELFIDI